MLTIAGGIILAVVILAVVVEFWPYLLMAALGVVVLAVLGLLGLLWVDYTNNGGAWWEPPAVVGGVLAFLLVWLGAQAWMDRRWPRP